MESFVPTAVLPSRVPLCEEFDKNPEFPNPDTYRTAFGSWNEGIKIAGFNPNSSSLGRVMVAVDGHKCRSFGEKIINDWFTKNNILHEKEASYPNSRYKADWKINNVYIEYFGISSNQKSEINQNYQKTFLRKRKLCTEQNLILIELYQKDLSNLLSFSPYKGFLQDGPEDAQHSS